ncbi:hypothetical protein P171DRAFT_439278 [Karstenula rhodostoma CBS 690.94]|uniref:Uncharacterized protein n=1 Tax=Karstenula rhodostoma CBS 690.94 TaxID=1392251 RepID=A0A9P4UII3_9PLEO|nr:hypothetical protein P171DRAFT_439278 [Karstenula rhodostoma CBS 690.94]
MTACKAVRSGNHGKAMRLVRNRGRAGGKGRQAGGWRGGARARARARGVYLERDKAAEAEIYERRETRDETRRSGHRVWRADGQSVAQSSPKPAASMKPFPLAPAAGASAPTPTLPRRKYIERHKGPASTPACYDLPALSAAPASHVDLVPPPLLPTLGLPWSPSCGPSRHRAVSLLPASCAASPRALPGSSSCHHPALIGGSPACTAQSQAANLEPPRIEPQRHPAIVHVHGHIMHVSADHRTAHCRDGTGPSLHHVFPSFDRQTRVERHGRAPNWRKIYRWADIWTLSATDSGLMKGTGQEAAHLASALHGITMSSRFMCALPSDPIATLPQLSCTTQLLRHVEAPVSEPLPQQVSEKYTHDAAPTVTT